MSADATDKVELECRRDGLTLRVSVRIVSEFEGQTWPDRTAGEILVAVRATTVGVHAGDGEESAGDQAVIELRRELATQLEAIAGIGEMGGEDTPPLIHGADAVSYVDIVIRGAVGGASVAAGKALYDAALAKVRGVLAKRRELSSEDWREGQRYL
jgi:hypothetical protein